MKKIVTLLLSCLSISAFALQVSDSLYISSSDNVANLIMSTADYDNWIQNNGFYTNQRLEIPKKLYQYFKDDFDVIMLISNETSKPATISYYGVNWPLANSVEGIGMSIYSNASYVGSEGKLFSIMHLPYLDAIKFGPTLHEFCHCWANSAIPTVVSGHWGFCGGNTPGQLGGFKQSTLESNVDGDPNKYTAEPFGANANGGNSVPYNELELYLMGMLPIDSVQEFDVFLNVPSESFKYYDDTHKLVTFTSDTHIHYTQASLIDSLGVRVPDFNHSQKSFKALFVVLSKVPLTEEEWTKSEEGINWYCKQGKGGISYLYNFWEATRGRGTIDPSNLSLSLKMIPTRVNQMGNSASGNTNKIIRNGQLLILRDGKTFTVAGQEAK